MIRDALGIRIEQLILHILDPRGSGVTLSELQMPVDGDDHAVRQAKYFISHLEGALADPRARAARFPTVDAGAASGICMALLNSAGDFIRQSQELASQLSEIIQSDGRIAAGTLAVCLYRAANQPEVPRYLGLMKLVPSHGFEPRAERDARDRLRVVLADVPNVLPTTREPVQKCALLQPRGMAQAYDMLLIDRQRVRGGDEPAQFFSQRFLGAKPAFTARDQTEVLYRHGERAINALEPNLTPEKYLHLWHLFDGMFLRERVNVDDEIDAWPVSDNERTKIKDEIAPHLAERVFDVDHAYVATLRKRLAFEADNGLRLSVPEEFARMVREDPLNPQPGRPQRYRISFETAKWKHAR